MNEQTFENDCESVYESEQEVEAEVFKPTPVPDPGNKITYIKLKCENCGGTLQTDVNNKLLCCPYCQSKTLVVNDSPLQVHKEIEIEKAHTYATMSTAKEQMRLDSKRKELAIVAVIAIIGLIALIVLIGIAYSS